MPERYKEEIEEILRQAGDLSPNGRRRRPRDGILRLIWQQLTDSVGGRGWSLTPGRVMLIAAGLLLSALFLGSVIPGLTGLLAWAGLILFIVGYGMFFVRPSKVEKRWRGRPVDDLGESPWQRLRRRLRGS